MAEKKVKGIWGWLLFYTIFISFRLVFGISMFIIFQELNILSVIEVLLLAIALISILIKSSNSKIINIGYLLISILLVILAYFDKIIGSTLQDRANGVGAIVGATVVSIIWISYLIKSKRVKNTFVN